jgi:hypothetical protein
MHVITRRKAMEMFGLASITPLVHAQAITSRQVVITTPGENRFAYTVPGLKTGAPCKLTAKDTGGACSIFELITPPRMGAAETCSSSRRRVVLRAPGRISLRSRRRRARFKSWGDHLGATRHSSRMGQQRHHRWQDDSHVSAGWI